MSLTVGQQIDEGQIVVASINNDGSFNITFTSIAADGPGTGPLSLTVAPSTTVQALEDLLTALLNVI